MKLGKEAMEALRAEVTGCLRPGEELVVAGPVALQGTALLAEEKYNQLRSRFSEGFLKSSMSVLMDYGCKDEENSVVWKMALEHGASGLYAMGEGGFLSGLWKLAEASQVGLRADLRKVPIRQETIEICEVFDLNPYRLLSGGAVLFGVGAGEALVQELKRMGISAAVIGQTDDGNDRLLYSGENTRYLDRPTEDEVYKVCSRR